MTFFVRTILLLVVVLSAGCAQKMIPAPGTEPVPGVSGLSGYEKALVLFENDRYVEALEGFNAFLRETDDDQKEDDALLKIGEIYRIIGRGDDAASVFSRMIREYPESDLVSEAMLEIMSIDFEKGDYSSVIEKGRMYTGSTDPTIHRSPFFILIADAYQASGSNLEAARFYYRAWNTADGADAAAVWTQFNQSIERLDATELRSLMVEEKDPGARGTLLYRLAMAFVLDEKYDEAIAALRVFVDRHPEHPGRQDAEELILSIEERSRFTPFTVGCVMPLSGAYGVYGERALNGIEMALIQSSKVHDGIAFTLRIQDSRSDPQETIKAVEELDRQRVGAVLGPMIASESAAATAQARGIPIFVFTQREGVVDIGPYVFRNFITPQMQARSLVSFAVEELGASRFAILFPEEKYGRRYMHLFWDQVIEHEAVVTAVEAYDPTKTDFAEPIQKLAGVFYHVPKRLSREGVPRVAYPLLHLVVNPEIADSQRIEDPVERISGIPLDRERIDTLGRRARDVQDQWNPILDFDAVFIPDSPRKAGLIIPQLVYYDIRDVLLMGPNLWNSEVLLEMSGGYMQDALIVDGFFADSSDALVKDFVTTFQQIYDRMPGIIEAVAYDNAMMVFETMRQTATDSRRELKQALLQTVDFDGVTGQTAFFPNGEADKALQLLRVEQGKFRQRQ